VPLLPEHVDRRARSVDPNAGPARLRAFGNDDGRRRRYLSGYLVTLTTPNALDLAGGNFGSNTGTCHREFGFLCSTGVTANRYARERNIHSIGKSDDRPRIDITTRNSTWGEPLRLARSGAVRCRASVLALRRAFSAGIRNRLLRNLGSLGAFDSGSAIPEN
jgi:hypothetical protein